MAIEMETTGGEDRFYMVVFSSQAEPNVPHNSHVFALFVKARVRQAESSQPVEFHTISWLPLDGKIDPLVVKPVEGMNFTLDKTLTRAKALDAHVTAWGPFPIQPDLYQMAVSQVNRLNEAKIKYVMVDVRHRGNDASNCIHAIADLDTTQAPLTTGLLYGDAAAQLLCEHFKPYVFVEKQPPSLLLDHLGIDSERIRVMSKFPTQRTRLSQRLQAGVAEYGSSHQTSENKFLHYLGIPVLMITAVGLLAKLTLPFDNESGWLQPSAAWIFLLAATTWYIWVDAVTSILLCSMFFVAYLIGSSLPLIVLGVGFGIGAIAHIFGHAAFEKKPPSLLRKPISVLVAPAWLLKRMGY